MFTWNAHFACLTNDSKILHNILCNNCKILKSNMIELVMQNTYFTLKLLCIFYDFNDFT